MSSLRLIARKTAFHPRTRLFTTTPYIQKSASETAKDTLKNVDRSVSDAAIKGIEKGQQATQNIKSTIGVKSKEAEGSAKATSGDAQGKASELAGSAKEMSGDAKGKASELAGEAKGKAQEVKGQASGKAEEVKSKM